MEQPKGGDMSQENVGPKIDIPQTDITLNGRKIDIAKVLPLKLRDWKQLEKKGINPKSMQETRLTDLSTIIHYILNKADSTVTEDEVDDLDLNHPTLKAVLTSLNAVSGGGTDRPS